jgi:uncharacterized coiled-coil protein SlyX
MTQPSSRRPGPRARWGLITVLIFGIGAALLLLAREDHRWEVQKAKIKKLNANVIENREMMSDIQSKVLVNTDKLDDVEATLDEHDERSKQYIEEHP